jgi:glyoxylate reductase
MDIVSVNCPHTPATYHLLSAPRLKLLRPDAIIVNTARGEVIDENALARMLEQGEIGGAGLDVFEHEPAVNPRLLKAEAVSCFRIWARRLLRAASIWARRSSSTSRPG